MKKNLVRFSFLVGGVSLVISGCAPELARTNYGPEEQQWKNYVQSCYDTWAPPPAPAPYSENNTSTSDVSTIEEPLPTTNETTIPIAAVDPEIISLSTDSSSNTDRTTVVPEVSVPNTYKVNKGDSLWMISKNVYGDGKYWKKILDANKDKLSSPSSIKTGMILHIPAKE